MKTYRLIATARPLVALLALVAGVQAATTELATAPLSGAATVQIFPNIMFVLDDSLSMDDDALPDWANGAALHRGRNAGFNGIAYNPAVLYSPPNYFTAQGVADTTTYPSQTSAATTAWQAVANDGYKVQNQNTADLRRAAFFHTTVAGEYCKDKTLRECTAANAATVDYPVAATLRWCNDLTQSLAATPVAGTCRAAQTDLSFKYPRMPEPQTSQLTISGTASVDSIKVDGKELLAAAVPSLAGNALASEIETQINACTYGKTGVKCEVVGYSAVASGSVVTISAPKAFADMTPVLVKAGGGTITASKFGRWGSNQAPGDVTLTVITDPLSSYAYLNAPARTDCSGVKDKTCTYDQEMTNYANWWAYYHTRMQTMKTAASASFAKIDETRRIGYMSINNNTSSDFLNISEFSPQQKKDWYDKLFAAKPGKDTPLRVALSTAGYLYAGKYNQKSLYGVSVKDPVQYYCQKNTTILSTDGYWNEGAGFKLDGTAVGDQDGIDVIPLVERPQFDGGAPQPYQLVSQIQQTTTPTKATLRQVKTEQLQSDTSQLQVSTLTQPQSRTSNLLTRTINLVDQTSQLQAVTTQLQTSTKTDQQIRTKTANVSSTGQLQKRTLTNWNRLASNLQTRTSNLQSSTSTLQTQTSKLQTQTYTLQTQTTALQQTLTQVQARISNDSGLTWGAWTNVTTCDVKASGIDRRQCQTLSPVTSTVASCTVTTGYTNQLINAGLDTETYQSKTGSSCAYGAPSGFSNAAGTCTTQAKSAGGEGSTWVGPATDCQYTAGSGLVDAVASCTAVAKSGASPYTVLTARDCQYTAWTALANAAAACTPAAQSNASPYTVLTARNCQYTAFSAWANSATACTKVAQDLATYSVLTARQCQYTAFGSWSTAASTCTAAAQDPVNYTVVTARECQYPAYAWENNVASCAVTAESVAPGPYSVLKAISQCTPVWTGWANAATCNASATVDCQYTWTANVADATCPGSAVAPSAGPNYTVQNPKICSVDWTPWVLGACTPIANQVECQKGWTPWADTAVACTKTGTYGDMAAPDGAVDCRYGTPSAKTNVASCTTATKSPGPTNYTVVTARTCSYAAFVTADANAATCTTVAKSGASPYTVGVAHTCSYTGTTSAWITAASCTATVQAGANWTGPKRECQYDVWTSYVNDASCPGSALAQSPASPYTVGQAKECSVTWTQPPVNTNSCAEDGTHHCTYAAATGWQNAATCTAAAYDLTQTGRKCQTVTNDWHDDVDIPSCEEKVEINATGLTTSYRCKVPPPTTQYVATCDVVDEIADEQNGYITKHCTTTLAKSDVDACTPLLPQGCPTNDASLCKTVTCGSKAKGATPDTLADVAQYYYMTDLRDPSLSNCAPDGDASKNVCEGPDPANVDKKIQRMTTYTLGLGASGLMQYDPDYAKAKEADSSDFASIKWVTQADPSKGLCSWQANGDCNWPTPASNSQTNIDDLWHAAVNGRGTYFNAREPSALAAGISSALADIGSAVGALAAVTVASPSLVAGNNNSVFEVSFEVGVWAGDVVKLTVNGDNGAISPSAVWSAEDRLRRKMTKDGVQAPDDGLRTIYTLNPGGESVGGAADNLKFFVWSALTDTEKAFFAKDYINGKLSQFCPAGGVTCLLDATKDLASGENLLKFLRGDRTYEGELDNLNAYYRKRTTKGSDVHRPLGDIAGSEAVFVQTPPWNYVDKQYAEFKLAKAVRKAMVYVGANDGMLHAFDADTGDEVWAYVPSVVLPKLYKLADKNYAGLHQFSVDGTPVIGDICTENPATCSSANDISVWKTILVGGLNGGGRGYYALDITDPAKPKALWEFTNDNLGFTYGNPVITKLKDGTWVVIVASGYNNVTPGDGVGRVFILNAKTGVPIDSINANGTISTGVGDTTTPSGLAKLTAWANFPDVNNTAERVYGGDLLGNLWRFDINGDIPKVADPKVYDAQQLATLKAPDGTAQPITAKPELGKIKNYPVIFVGTGRLLGPHDFEPINQDVPKFQKQSFYAIKDKLDLPIPDPDGHPEGTPTAYGNPRTAKEGKVDKDGNPVDPVDAFTTWTLGAGVCPDGVAFCKKGQATVTVADLPRNVGETDEEYAARVEKTRQQTITDAFGPYNDGWYIDLPGDGEQSNTDPGLFRGSLVFTTNRPLEGGGCEPKATSFVYFLDYRTGSSIEGTNGIVGRKIADALATKAAVAVLTNDKLFGFTRTDQPGLDPGEIPTPPPGDAARRVSWRELVTE